MAAQSSAAPTATAWSSDSRRSFRVLWPPLQVDRAFVVRGTKIRGLALSLLFTRLVSDERQHIRELYPRSAVFVAVPR